MKGLLWQDSEMTFTCTSRQKVQHTCTLCCSSHMHWNPSPLTQWLCPLQQLGLGSPQVEEHKGQACFPRAGGYPGESGHLKVHMCTQTHTPGKPRPREQLYMQTQWFVVTSVLLLPRTEIGSLVLATSRPSGDRGRITVEQCSTGHACAFPLPSPIPCAPSGALTH